MDQWVNTAIGNIKTAIVGTYRAIHGKDVPRYLAEFEYRFNRRYDFAAMLPASAGLPSAPRQCPSVSSNWLRLRRTDAAAMLRVVLNCGTFGLVVHIL